LSSFALKLRLKKIVDKIYNHMHYMLGLGTRNMIKKKLGKSVYSYTL